MRSNSANVKVDGFVLLSGHIHTHHVAGIDVVNGKVTWKVNIFHFCFRLLFLSQPFSGLPSSGHAA